MKIAICEDNEAFALDLKKIIDRKFIQYNLECEIHCFYSGEEILSNIDNTGKKYDIIFFDIELPRLSGIEVATKIREKYNDIIFIFITYLNEKVYEVLDLNIFHFIRKDYFYEEVDSILKLLIKKIDYLFKVYKFPVDSVEMYFKLNDIIYLEVLDRQLLLHTADNEYISNYRTLKDIPFKIKENYFFEIYRGILVNLSHVNDFIDDKVILSNEAILYLARRRIKDFKQEFFKYISTKREE